MKILKLAIVIASILLSNSWCAGRAQQVDNLFHQNHPSACIQMHVHAMSNHNGSNKPASIQLHSLRAKEKYVDVIMWSEHSGVFTQDLDVKFGFVGGAIDSATQSITNINGNAVHPVEWIANITGGQASSRITDSTLTMQLTTSFADSAIESFIYTPKGRYGALKGSRYFNRPLSSKPVLNFNFLPQFFSNNDEAIINVKLTYHYYNNVKKEQRIFYKLSSSVQIKMVNVIDHSNVEITIPVVSGQNQNISLPIGDDALYLKDGLDNTTLSYDFGVSVTKQSTAIVTFDNIRLYSQFPDPLNQYSAFGQFINDYHYRYDIQGFQGCEWQALGGMHFNGFLPDTTSDIENLFIASNQPYAEFTNRIKGNGGLITINHPFGTGNTIASDSLLDYRTDTLALYYMANDIFNADIMEVAYNKRIGDLPHHFKLWDKLNANGYFIYGNGVNDLHGTGWDAVNNNFGSSIWGESPSQTKIIEALKKGRFFSVATNNAWQKFDFAIGDYRMGYKGESDCFIDTLKYQLDYNLPNAEFRLTQGLIKNGLEVEYLYNDFLLDENEKMALRLDKPCFIRMTVTNPGESIPFIISNPIFITNLTAPIGSLLECIKPKSGTTNHILTVYPNPAINFLTTDLYLFEKATVSFSITSNNGKMITSLLRKKVLERGLHKNNWSISNLSAGTYYLNFSINKKNYTRQILITK